MQIQEKVTYVCHCTHKNGDIVKPQQHTCYELVYYCSGKGYTTLGGQQYTIAPNTFSLIPPHMVHSEYHYADSNIIFIGFQYNASAKFTESFFNDDDNLIVLSTLTSMVNELNNRRKDYRTILWLKLRELLIFISRLSLSADIEKSKNDTIEFAAKYIEQSYVSPINWKELAASCNYSYDYFHHLFKRETGLSPTQYLLNCRLSAAKELLLTTNDSCSEIAYSCGFANSAQFSTMFRKHFGVSPIKMRQTVK